jgi:putative endonuclease
LMHYVYVLRSVSDHGLYIGYSANLRRRFEQHVKGDSVATSHRGPWKLIYYEAYLEQSDALGRERYVKSGAGRRFLRAQLAHYLRKNPIRSKLRTSPSGLPHRTSGEAA